MDRALLASKLDAAKRDVTEAEADIEKLIAELRATVRADKTTISAGLAAAFNKLRAARFHLEALETLLASDREGD